MVRWNLEKTYLRDLDASGIRIVPTIFGGEPITANGIEGWKAQLNAEKLVMLSDVPGVCRDHGDEKTLISSLNRKTASQMIAEGTISGGMIPKVEACMETLDRGVRKVHIINGRKRHSLLLEVYTTHGIGTVIS